MPSFMFLSPSRPIFPIAANQSPCFRSSACAILGAITFIVRFPSLKPHVSFPFARTFLMPALPHRVRNVKAQPFSSPHFERKLAGFRFPTRCCLFLSFFLIVFFQIIVQLGNHSGPKPSPRETSPREVRHQSLFLFLAPLPSRDYFLVGTLLNCNPFCWT